MAEQGGQLLIVRRRLTIPPGDTTVITGIVEPSRSGTPDPSIDGIEPTVDDPGRASRVMVVPAAPLESWLGITHDEPHIGASGTVEVVFTSINEEEVEINVCFWDPHTLLAPVSADTYNAQPEPAPPCDNPEGCFPVSGSVYANGTS